MWQISVEFALRRTLSENVLQIKHLSQKLVLDLRHTEKHYKNKHRVFLDITFLVYTHCILRIFPKLCRF